MANKASAGDPLSSSISVTAGSLWDNSTITTTQAIGSVGIVDIDYRVAPYKKTTIGIDYGNYEDSSIRHYWYPEWYKWWFKEISKPYADYTNLQELVDDMNKRKKEKKVSVIDEIKDIEKKPDERLLSKYNIVDSEGRLTDEGEELMLQLIFEERRDVVIGKLKAVEAAKKKKRKEEKID